MSSRPRGAEKQRTTGTGPKPASPSGLAPLSVSQLKQTAGRRPEGFIAAILAAGRIEGDQIHLDETAVNDLRVRFPDPWARRPKIRPAPPPIIYNVAQLQGTKGQKPKGFVDFILTHGQIEGDQVTLSGTALTEFYARYLPDSPPEPMPANGRYQLEAIKADATRRPPGYLEFILARTKIEGDSITLDPETRREIREKFPVIPAPHSGEPTLVQMASHFTQAMTAWAKAGFKVVTAETLAERHGICRGCEYWEAEARAGFGKCRRCGCSMAMLWLASSRCPLDPPKWARLTE